MKQQVVFIEGPSNAGKSTAVDTLLKNRKRVFHINMDKIKWSISDYSNKDIGYKIMLQKMIRSMAEIALSEGLSLFIESQKQLVDLILELSKSQNIEVKYINIEAPLDTLKQRFHLRVENAKKEGRKLGNTSEEKLLEIYYEYQKNKFDNGITIDTSKLSKEEVILEIEKYIGTTDSK